MSACIASETHECLFPEEREPGGRLILAPCLTCGLAALDAMAQLRDKAPSGDDWEWGVRPNVNGSAVLWSTSELSARARFTVYSKQTRVYPRVALVRRRKIDQPVEVVAAC